MLSNLALGLGNLVIPANFIWLLVGVFVGLAAGATPGISGTMTVAILIPITYGMDSIPAFILLTSVYAVAVYSGSITAVLFRAPGAPEAAATVMDGYAMTKKGEPHRALGYAMFSSFLGGTIGAIVLLLVSPQLAKVALEFGSPEVFSLIAFTMVAVSSINVKNRVKGLIAAFFGLLLATVGLDVITSVPRYTFGISVLQAGFDFIPVILGLFGVSEALRMIQGPTSVGRAVKKVRTVLPRIKEIKEMLPTYLRSIPIGIGIGALPGVGATTASFVTYAIAARVSKEPEKFGTGIPEGICAPESANNAAAMGAMVPLLSLGIPGSATTAVMLGALTLHGLRAGPLLFTHFPEFSYTILISAIVANILIIVVSPIFIRFFARIFQIPTGIIGTGILVLSVVGSFAIRNNIVDIWIVLIFGLLGYVLEKHDFPMAPIVIGLVLGQLGEQELRRSLIISGGDPSIFFVGHPISLTFLAISVGILLIPVFKKLKGKFR
jgi:putative tricarboxylic transport membrane protein